MLLKSKSECFISRGNVEELFDMNLGAYAIAAAEDCSKRLSAIVNMDDLKAIQRRAEKSWGSEKSYDKDVCLPDFNLLLLDPRKLEKNLIDAISWWSKALNDKTQRFTNSLVAFSCIPQSSIIMYLHGFLVQGKSDSSCRLPVSWKLNGSSLTEVENENNILPFDGSIKICSQNIDKQQSSSHGNLWNKYITPNFDAILSHNNRSHLTPGTKFQLHSTKKTAIFTA